MPGDFDDASKLHFTPAPSNRRRAQRARQLFRRRTDRGDLLAEHRVGGHPLVLDFAEPVVDLLQRLRDRLLIALERGLCEIEERGTVVLERLGGERLKRLAQPRVRLVEQLLR